uniref:Methyltransferase type 12 domain-containing protein n=1 Tax=Haptolina ericina TaxID=156174 RepID=A0A7S3B700_9EUKA
MGKKAPSRPHRPQGASGGVLVAFVAAITSVCVGMLCLHLESAVKADSSSQWLYLVTTCAYMTRSPHDVSPLEIAYAEAALRDTSVSAASAAADAVLARQPICTVALATLDCASLAARANGVLAEAHLLTGQLPRALDAVQAAVEALEQSSPAGNPPSDGTERQRYARLHVTKGRVLEALPADKCAAGTCNEHAANAYRRALQVWPELAEATSALSRISATLSGASPAYVEALFDEYAGRFDEALVERLHYQAPKLLVAAVRSALASRGVQLPVLRALDAGCGTGLAGLQLRPLVTHLAGVDLSAKMIERARQRGGVYDSLAQSELVTFLLGVEAPDRYGLIACADVLNYLADLQPVLAAAAAALQEGGLLAFTLELPVRDSTGGEREVAGWRWEALPSGRYAHNADWVAEEASRQGLGLVHRAAVPKLRVDGGEPVPGSLIVLVKGDGTP